MFLSGIDGNLKRAVDLIVDSAHPKKIVLFGSRGRGDSHPESDFDILIVADSHLPRYQRSIPIRRAVQGLFPSKDIVVFTPQEISDWSDVPNAFVTTALNEGLVLYEKD